MNKGGFSWKRALGISAAKSRLSRQIGIPLTRSGRQRKAGAAVGCAAIAGAFLVVALCVLSVYVVAEPLPDPAAKRITLKSDTPISIKAVMEKLLDSTGFSVRFEQGADPAAAIPAFSFSDVTVESAVKAVARSANLALWERGEVYVLQAKSRPSATLPAPEQTPSVTKPAPVPKTGMTKFEVRTALGAPLSTGSSLNGSDVWYYPEWVVTFSGTTVKEAQDYSNKKLAFKSSGKSVPYFELVKRMQELEIEAQQRKQEAVRQHYRNQTHSVATELSMIRKALEEAASTDK